MKVVQLINGLGRGGAERMLVELVRELRGDVDFEVYVLTRGGPLEAELRELGVEAVHLTTEGRPHPGAWPRFVAAVRGADVLHTHLLYCDLVGASLRQAGVARRWISTRHELGFEMNRVQRRFEPWVMGRADAVLAVSQAVKDAMASRGCRVDHVQIVEPTLSPWWYEDVPPFEGREKLIVSVGRLEHVKGHDLLLDEYAALPVSERAEWRLALVGAGSRRAALEAQARALGIADRVQFVGELDPRGVRDWLDRARVFVLPSRSEALGLALLEAEARGVQWVAKVGNLGAAVTCARVGTSNTRPLPGTACVADRARQRRVLAAYQGP